MKNRVMILHTDDEWLVLKPLSMEASVNYGYGTKWCTSMKNSNSYFYRYSRDGVLLFVINRKNGVKYAIYSSPKEFSVWTATDARIDSMETTIPFDLMMRMKEWTNFDEVGPNYNYFEDEDKEDRGTKKSGRLVALGALTNQIDEPIESMGEYDMEERGYDEEEGDMSNMTPSDPINLEGESEVSVSFRSDTWSDEEVMVESEDDEEMEVSVDIRNYGEDMVGYEDSVHGSITEQNERTWENPYPNGPGGGFEHLDDPVDDFGHENNDNTNTKIS